MKNKKQKRRTLDFNHLKILVVVLAIASLLFGGALAFSLPRIKTTDEERYLELYPALLHAHIMEFCLKRINDSEANVVSWCEAKDYGVSRDGDPFVIFDEQKYDSQTWEPIGGTTTNKLYFWQSGEWTFSEAIEQ